MAGPTAAIVIGTIGKPVGGGENVGVISVKCSASAAAIYTLIATAKDEGLLNRRLLRTASCQRAVASQGLLVFR